MMAEAIITKQAALWALHDKAAKQAERREIERQIGELEKKKKRDTIELVKKC